MEYRNIVRLALKGRSVNQAAKDWGIPQKSLDTYVKAERLPDYATAFLMANEAGVEPGVMFAALAMETAKRKNRPAPALAAVLLAVAIVGNFVSPSPAEAAMTQGAGGPETLCIMSNGRRKFYLALRRTIQALMPTAALTATG